MTMDMYSEYKEDLLSGGALIVTKKGWWIEYYFNGPDFRHNGQSVTISSIEIDSYIEAYKKNFEKYLSLHEVIPKGGEFECKGDCNMTIGYGGYRNGVTIAHWYNHLSNSCFPIKTKDDLDKVINDYQYCKRRSEEITSLLYKK